MNSKGRGSPGALPRSEHSRLSSAWFQRHTGNMADAAAVDPLAKLNDELRERGEIADDSPWLPLESNPEVFSAFAHSVGCPPDWRWVDVLGLDDELLAMVPQPCAGVILLFPCTDDIYHERAIERARLLAEEPSAVITASFHITQVVGFGNACGTIASVHALINGAHAFGGLKGGDDGAPAPLADYRDSVAALAPEARGQALLKARALKATSDDSATHVSAQTECPSRDGPDLDHHFVAFSPVVNHATSAVHVVELDGTKVSPVDHGEVNAESTFLSAVASIIRKRYMQIEPDSIEFSLMALCHDPST